MNLCNHCGHENSESARFCSRCGKPLSADKSFVAGRNENPYGSRPDQGKNYAHLQGDHPLPPPPPPQSPPDFENRRNPYRDGNGLENLEDDPSQRKAFNTIIMVTLTLLVVGALAISAFVVTRSLTGGGFGEDQKASEERTKKGKKKKEEETADHSDKDKEEEPTKDYDEIDMSDLGEGDENDSDGGDSKDSDSDSDDSDDSDEDPYGDFVFPDSDERYLSESEVNARSNEDRRLAINEIYARRGYDFKNPDIKRHFQEYDWYDPIYKDQNDVPLNKYEKKNVDLLAEYRK